MSDKRSKKQVTLPTVITLMLPTPEVGGIAPTRSQSLLAEDEAQGTIDVDGQCHEVILAWATQSCPVTPR